MKRVEHHQTVITTFFRVVDDERSYDAPTPIQQVAYVLSEQEFSVALERIRKYMDQVRERLAEEEDAERDQGD